jgi:hypothetical protein
MKTINFIISQLLGRLIVLLYHALPYLDALLQFLLRIPVVKNIVRALIRLLMFFLKGGKS